LFPHELFENEKTRSLCTKVDNLLASNMDIAARPYIVAVIRKSGKFIADEKLKNDYERVIELLRIHKINLNGLKSHSPAHTISDIIDIFEFDLKKRYVIKNDIDY